MTAAPHDLQQGTHWDDCWRERGHHACAIAKIENLLVFYNEHCGEVERLRSQLSTNVCRDWKEAEKRAEKAEAERDALKQDAMRYRWVRIGDMAQDEVLYNHYGTELDSAIDAQLGKAKDA